MNFDLKAIRIIPNTKATFDIKGKGANKKINVQSYRALVDGFFADKRPVEERNLVGIIGKINRLVIIDVDSGINHKHNGFPWWNQFCAENAVPETYTVQTPNNGLHLYFRLPLHMDEETFFPPGELSPGVDVIYNGYILAPPSPGYNIVKGSLFEIEFLPPTIMMAFEHAKMGLTKEFTAAPSSQDVNFHHPFTPEQINELKAKIEMFRISGTLTYQEWRDAIFSLKAGIPNNEELLYEMVSALSYNQSYQPGDEDKAMEMAQNASEFGRVGPGTIFQILKDVVVRSASPIAATPYTRFEVLNKAGVKFTLNSSGDPKIAVSEASAASIIEAIYEPERLFYDKRNQQFTLDGKYIPETDLITKFLPMLQSDKGMGLGQFKKNQIQNALDIISQARGIDPHMDRINNTVWDGVNRIEKFFPTHFRSEANEYHREVARCFWLSFAARSLNPGCKVDFMLVLEGHEGINKSSIVKAMGGDYTYTPTNDNLFQSNDCLREMHQSVVVELPELLGLEGKDPKVVKACITVSEDDMRPLYARKAVKRPRGFIFIGTTNNSRYLKQEYGSRRFLPVRIPKGVKVDLKGIQVLRDQYLAEAAHRVKQGEPWWNLDKDLLKLETNKRKIVDPVREFIITTCSGRTFVTPIEIYRSLISMDLVTKGFNQVLSLRITNTLEELGFEEVEGATGSTWVNPSFKEPLFPITTDLSNQVFKEQKFNTFEDLF